MKPQKIYTLGLTACSLVFSAFAWAMPAAETDFSVAAEKAKKEQISMLVEFTGSDWCPPCKQLRKTVLDTPAFEKYVQEKGALFVELDFPRKPGAVAPEVMKAREEVMMKYGIRGFPTVLLLDSDGKPYAQIVGPGKSSAHYFEQLDAAFALEKEFKTAVDAASNAGEERANALVAALEKLPKNLQGFQKDLICEIIAADPDDRLGFAKKMREGELLVEQQKMLKAFFESVRGKISPDKLAETRAEALALLDDKTLLPPIRLALNKFVSDGYAMEHNLAKALEYLKLAQASDPESRDGQMLLRWIEQMEKVIAAQKEAEASAVDPAPGNP